jgi:hypothetical protein
LWLYLFQVGEGKTENHLSDGYKNVKIKNRTPVRACYGQEENNYHEEDFGFDYGRNAACV